MIKYKTREEWLSGAVKELEPELTKQAQLLAGKYPHFNKPFPSVKVSVTQPTRGKAIGTCWSDKASSKGYCEIFISATEDNPMRVLDILTHELCHAVDGLISGHGTAFKRLAYAMGLTGKPTATVASDEFKEKYKPVIKSKLGDYPHAKMNLSSAKKKQNTRLIKVSCSNCDNSYRQTKKFIDLSIDMNYQTYDMDFVSTCPICSSPMIVK
tara:strand:+ start:502 stop:1134 length:633 start_codon:yes stop_codon:yes gene_type:complete